MEQVCVFPQLNIRARHAYLIVISNSYICMCKRRWTKHIEPKRLFASANRDPVHQRSYSAIGNSFAPFFEPAAFVRQVQPSFPYSLSTGRRHKAERSVRGESRGRPASTPGGDLPVGYPQLPSSQAKEPHGASPKPGH